MKGLQSRWQRLILIAAPLMLALFDPVSTLFTTLPSATRDPTVLVVGDFSGPQSFAVDVYAAADARRKDLNPNLNVIKLDCRDGERPALAQERFLDLLFKHRVIGVISADTTQTLPQTIMMAETFKLPVLVSVATGDGLLPSSGHTTFRLVPRNSEQARIIANAVTTPAIIVYHDSDYGHGLSAQICAFLDHQATQYLRVRSATPVLQMNDALSRLQWHPGCIIYVGYPEELNDLLHALPPDLLKLPLLLSDGCYSKTIKQSVASFKVNASLCFPIDPFSNNHDVASGFGEYGRDALVLLYNATGDTSQPMTNTVLSDVARDLEQKKQLRTYDFDSSGENTKAQFTMIPLTEAKAP